MPKVGEVDGSEMAKRNSQFEAGAKVLTSLIVSFLLLLFLYAYGLSYWLGVLEEDLPGVKAIQAMIKGPGLPILVWWVILFGTVGMVIGGLYGFCYFIYLFRRRN
jgi:hypothetical protein